jgi:hypothetical protein
MALVVDFTSTVVNSTALSLLLFAIMVATSRVCVYLTFNYTCFEVTYTKLTYNFLSLSLYLLLDVKEELNAVG